MGKGRPDVLVVGAGIFGLAAAWECLRRGLRVVVADAGQPGAGASGGLVGALAPHPPERWSAKKAFQLEALLGAASWWRAVGAAGGVSAGYARTGRLIPLARPRARALAEARAIEARERWPASAGWEVLPPPALPAWLSPEAAPFGAVRETLSARLYPRHAVAALAAAVIARGGEILVERRALELRDGVVRFDAGEIAARVIVVAGGVQSHRLLQAPDAPGVKGQALLAGGGLPLGAPLVAADDLLIVPHGDGTVAVGATTENAWSDPGATDARLDALWRRAGAICPGLRGARVIERWAGLRPRGPRPDPMLGPVPGSRGILAATGGYKLGFGLAPAIGRAIAAMACGETVSLPPGFSAAEQLGQGSRTRPPAPLA